MDVKLSADKKSLVITVPLEEPRPSSTGNTLIVASSGGAMSTGIQHPTVKGAVIKTSFSFFIPNPDKPKAPGKGGWKPNIPAEEA